jgi:hypothetical protein
MASQIERNTAKPIVRTRRYGLPYPSVKSGGMREDQHRSGRAGARSTQHKAIRTPPLEATIAYGLTLQPADHVAFEDCNFNGPQSS